MSKLNRKRPKAQAFAERLRSAREKLGLSQENLAKAVGVSVTTVQNYESGQFPKGEVTVNLAQALSCTTDWLLRGHEPMPPGAPGQPGGPGTHGSHGAHGPQGLPDSGPQGVGGQNAREPAAGKPLAEVQFVPITGLSAGPHSGWFNPGPLALRTPLPMEYLGRNVFAVVAVGQGMPLYGIGQGQVLFCDPDVPPSEGDVVFVEKTDGTVTVRMLGSPNEYGIPLRGWLESGGEGHQKPYIEEVPPDALKSMSCVVMVRLKP